MDTFAFCLSVMTDYDQYLFMMHSLMKSYWAPGPYGSSICLLVYQHLIYQFNFALSFDCESSFIYNAIFLWDLQVGQPPPLDGSSPRRPRSPLEDSDSNESASESVGVSESPTHQ